MLTSRPRAAGSSLTSVTVLWSLIKTTNNKPDKGLTLKTVFFNIIPLFVIFNRWFLSFYQNKNFGKWLNDKIVAIKSKEFRVCAPRIWHNMTALTSVRPYQLKNALTSELKVKGNTFIIIYVNPYKPSVLLVGHRQTAQTKIKWRRTRRLIRVPTICLQNSLLKFE